jgi:hypothetical protein
MTTPPYVHDVYVRGVLQYQFMDSIWYDTASPAQGCIARLQEIRDELPNVEIISFGTTYKIDTLDDFKRWTKDIFSPTNCNYECDFSKWL